MVVKTLTLLNVGGQLCMYLAAAIKGMLSTTVNNFQLTLKYRHLATSLVTCNYTATKIQRPLVIVNVNRTAVLSRNSSNNTKMAKNGEAFLVLDTSIE